MKVLVIKTSSLGDVIHTLPALTDAAKKIKGISFDWVVEESFQEIPQMHPNVEKIIPVSVRRWRKNLWANRAELKASLHHMQQQTYDYVIDAQGLIKSAIFTRYAKGAKYGLSKTSCQEPLATLAYRYKIDVPKGQHAITRVRQLFAKSLGYEVDLSSLSYGLQKEDCPAPKTLEKPYLVFLHGTTWASKHWPEDYWQELISIANKQGFSVYLPWGNEQEKERAERLSNKRENAKILKKSTIKELASILMHANGVVGVDSGLSHLTAACGTPAVTIYGATSAELTGTMGERNLSLQTAFDCSPCLQKDCRYTQASSVTPACYETLAPQQVFNSLQGLMT
ncbi:MAG: lipopolysaccharide heptosyltransferase I [Cycloclasticus sp.]